MTEPEAPKDKQMTRVTPDDMPTFYANFAEVSVSVFDLRIVLGIVREVKDNSVVIDEVARVMMSPQHAKSLASLLNKRLEIYEKRFGPIPTKPLEEGKAEDESEEAI